MREGAWRRVQLTAGGATCCRSTSFARSASACMRLESTRGIKWLTIEGTGGQFSYGAMIQEHTAEHDADGAAGNASRPQTAAGVSRADRRVGRRPMPGRRRSNWRWRATTSLPPTPRRSACRRFGLACSRRRPRRCCRCESAPPAPPAPSSPATRRSAEYWHDAGLLSMVAPQSDLIEAASGWFDAQSGAHTRPRRSPMPRPHRD